MTAIYSGTRAVDAIRLIKPKSTTISDRRVIFENKMV